jgi:hypothetical protein
VTSTVTVIAASTPVLTPVKGTGPVGDTTPGGISIPIREILTPLPISHITTPVVPGSHSKAHTVNAHTHKSVIKVVQHAKLVVKSHAHHPHGPLGK